MEWSEDLDGYIQFVINGKNYTRNYTAHALTTMFIDYIIGNYERRENVDVVSLAVTCPAAYRCGQRRLLKECGKLFFL